MDRSGRYVPLEKQFNEYRSKGAHSFYFCGGRGIGKTYAAVDIMYRLGTHKLSYNKEIPQEKFMFLRRTEVEAIRAADGISNVFKKYCMNEGCQVVADYTKKTGLGTFYDVQGETKEPIGYCAALSTFANSRGLDFSDVSLIVYDECIPESRNKHNLQDEGFLILNLLETINRNRIVEGQNEVYFMMLSNPIDLANSMLAQLNITSVMMKMILARKQHIYIKERGLFIARYSDVKVSKEKAEGMVYKLGKDTGFNERALTGDFVDNDMSQIRRKVDKRQLVPMISIDDIVVFYHKSQRWIWIAQTKAEAQYQLHASDVETLRMLMQSTYKLGVARKTIFYDDYQTKAVFDSLIGYRQPIFDK